MHQLFILTILLFDLLFIGRKWKVEKNARWRLKDSGISFLEESSYLRPVLTSVTVVQYIHQLDNYNSIYNCLSNIVCAN